MEIWPVEPQAVERLCDVAGVLVEGFESPIAAFAVIVAGVARGLGPHLATGGRPCRPPKRNHGERALAAGGMAFTAIDREHNLAALDGCGVGPVREMAAQAWSAGTARCAPWPDS